MQREQFRAKRLDNGEYFVSDGIRWIGDGLELRDNNEKMFDSWIACDSTTRSVSYPDMLDSEGTKVFASLSEDVKGGSILEYPDDDKSSGTVAYKEMIFSANGKECHINHFSFSKCKVTGIQE